MSSIIIWRRDILCKSTTVVRCIRSFEYYVGVGVFSESPESIIINHGTSLASTERDVRPVHCFISRCIFKPLIIFALA